MVLTFTCPWPPASIGANARRRLHWPAYRGDIKSYRDTCFWLAREAAGRRRIAANDIASVQIGFFPPDARRRDDDNHVSAFKAGRDGIASALGHDDAGWRGKVCYHFHPPFRPSGQIIVQIEVAA
jgi:crossover junction endodeoxyribonuclease RusA